MPPKVRCVAIVSHRLRSATSHTEVDPFLGLSRAGTSSAKGKEGETGKQMTFHGIS
jgi:hypothetical protein